MESTRLPSYSGSPRLLQPEERIRHVVQARGMAAEADEDRQKRLLADRRASYVKRRAVETNADLEKRLAATRTSLAKRRAAETD